MSYILLFVPVFLAGVFLGATRGWMRWGGALAALGLVVLVLNLDAGGEITTRLSVFGFLTILAAPISIVCGVFGWIAGLYLRKATHGE